MKLFDWITLKLKRMLVRVISPDLKGIEEYWDVIDPQDRFFSGLVLVWCVLFVSFLVLYFCW